MASKQSLKFFLLSLVLPNVAHGFWRMSCGITQTGRIDPVVSPGKVSSHVHKIAGASSIYLNSTYDSLNNAPCTSCEIQADKSAYWTPQLYYQHSDGSFEEVPNSGTVVYYLGRGDNRTNITPFPKGFQMLSGDASLRSYDNSTLTFGGAAGETYIGGTCANDTCTGGSFQPGAVSGGRTFYGRPVADRVSFNCLNYAGGNPETPGIPVGANCPDGLRAQIHFQSCWDGINTYKTDNSHVAYMSQIDNGICPPTHPVQLVHLFFEVLYGVGNIAQDGGRFVFAQGDATGYGFHGDFLNGWDMDVQTAALKDCANPDNNGQISACPALVASDIQNYGTNCPEQPAIVDEPVKGKLSKLPGCITVTSGPNPATSAEMNCPANAVPPTVEPPSTLKAPVIPRVGSIDNGWKYAGCANESTSGRTLSVASFASDNMTNEACQSFCASKSQPLAATEYSRECYCGSSLDPSSSLGLDCSKTDMICAGNSTQICGGPNLLSIWNSTTFVAKTQFTTGTKIGNYAYLGCASEGSSSRALTGASFTNSSGMTNDACGAFCSGKSFKLFGTEYSSECYCGNALTAGSTMSQTGCTMTCSGTPDAKSAFANYTNTCGGSDRLNVFNITRN